MQDTPDTQTTDLTPEGNAKLAWSEIKARALAGDAEAIAKIDETLQTLFHGGLKDHVLGYVCEGSAATQFGAAADPDFSEGRGKKEEGISLNSDTIHDAKAPATLSPAGAVSFPTNGVIEGSSEAGAGLEGPASADTGINLSEVAALLRVGHNVLPELVTRWGKMEERLSTIDESLDRAERRHVLQAWAHLRGKYPDAGAGVVEDAVERWRLGEVSMKDLEVELEGKGKEDQVDEGDTVDEEIPEQVAEEPLKSVWLADYDRATDKAAWTTLTLMAKPTDTERHAILNRLKGWGANCAPLYVGNGGDFGHVPGSSFRYTHAQKEEWHIWLRHMRAIGIEPILVLMSDDAPPTGLHWKDFDGIMSWWELVITDLVEPLGIRHVVPGLEALEYWTEAEYNGLGRWLRAVLPDSVRIGHHTMPRDTRMCGADWVNDIYWQEDFWAPEAQLIGDFGALKNQFPTKRIIAAEYSMEGDTDAAQALGNAALNWGAAGALNGFGSGGRPTSGGPQKAQATGQWKATPTHQPWDIGSGVKMLGPVTHPFDSAWRETIRLDGIEVFGGKIRFPFRKNGAWQTITQPDGSTSVGHLWVMQLVSGQFYASTIDWLRSADQQSKDFPGVMLGNHLLSPMGLKSGESYGFFVSTVARNGKRTSDERSNVVWVKLEEG